MFCGGSFRCKTVDKNDHYKLVKLNGGQHIKILRSSPVDAAGLHQEATAKENATGSTNRRIFLVPNKSVSLHSNSSHIQFRFSSISAAS